MANKLTIDLQEKFALLPKAPIVEAVLDFRAQTPREWEEIPLKARLESLVPEYSYRDSETMFAHRLEVRQGKPSQQLQDLGFKGHRFQSQDSLYIAGFNRDGFVFSRIQPYDRWETFKSEAIRLWAIHREVAGVSHIDRIGLRYINRIPMLEGTEIDAYIEPYPEAPRGLDLPFAGYLQRDTFPVPGHPYALTVIKTIQPAQDESMPSSIIVDIDAFTDKVAPIGSDPPEFEKHLEYLRWLKNKAFFGTVSQELLEQMKGEHA